MKLLLFLLLSLALAVTAKASKGFSAPDLDREKLEAILKQVDNASVLYRLHTQKVDRDRASYVVPDAYTGIVIDDKAWLDEISAFLRKLDGKPQHITAALSLDISPIALHHGDKALLKLMWANDERLIIYTPSGDDSWSVELKVGDEVLKQYQAICAKKRPPVETEISQKPQPLKVPMPKIDPASINIELPNQSAKPTTTSGPRG